MSEQGVLQVDTDQLRAHAKQIHGLAQGLGEGVSAGVHTAMDVQAFGVLCAFLVPPAVALQAVGIAALSGGVAALGAIETSLRGVAAGYDAIDDAVGGRLTDLMAGLS